VSLLSNDRACRKQQALSLTKRAFGRSTGFQDDASLTARSHTEERPIDHRPQYNTRHQ
jgi:hypothetical protein